MEYENIMCIDENFQILYAKNFVVLFLLFDVECAEEIHSHCWKFYNFNYELCLYLLKSIYYHYMAALK